MPRGHRFRIMGGIHRGRTLTGPPSIRTRPMQGFLREALFNILGSRVMGASALDLFSGTGSIGLEALSRGAAYCVFFEKAHLAHNVLRKNIESLGFENCSATFRSDLLKLRTFPYLDLPPFDLIFLDPPFPFHDPRTRKDLQPLIRHLQAAERLAEDLRLVLQVRNKQPIPDRLGPLNLLDSRNYGSVVLNFYA